MTLFKKFKHEQKLAKDSTFCIVFLKGNRFLMEKCSNLYIFIPKNLFIFILSKKMLCFSDDKEELKLFLKKLSKWLESTQNFYRKTLFLKGLGFKVGLKANKTLEFKLGFSHSNLVDLSNKEVLIKLGKQSITLEGLNKNLVGQEASKIRLLKKMDSYKGKGIFYKSEKIKLKAIKKK
jgi:hypothetical protein